MWTEQDRLKYKDRRNKENFLEWSRNYRKKNIDKIKVKDKKWRYNHKDEINSKNRSKYFSMKYKEIPMAIRLYRMAKNRAKNKGLEFSIEKEDIIIPDICPVLGISLLLDGGTVLTKDFSPSIDRFDSSKDYIKENIRVISWRANKLKSNGTLEEFKKIVKYMESNN